MDWIESLLGRSGFLPHGYCFTWSPGLLWSMVGADGVIAAAYFSIPLAILSFTRRRPGAVPSGVAWLFCGFIFACGVTHVMDIWTIWQPDYVPQMLAKGVTAAVSLVTAVLLWPMIPKLLALPSVAQLQAAVTRLEAEVGRRRSAEEHLADEQQNLALALESIGAGFIATDRRGRVTRMNATAERVTGWPQAEALGRIAWEVFEREGRSDELRARNPVDVLLDTGLTIETAQHYTAVSRHGTRTPVEVKAAPIRSGDGSVRGLAMLFRDMTQLNRAEHQQRQLAAIVESSEDAIISKTLDGRITSWNRAAQALFGYTPDEAIGQRVQMLIPPERQSEEMRILEDLALGRTVPTFNTVRQARDGTRLDVSITVSPIRDEAGRIVGASKIARDIRAQRRAEIALRESEARLRFALEAAQIGDWDLDLGTGVMRRSIRHDRCFGYDTLQSEWGIETFLRHVHPAHRAEVARAFFVAASQAQPWQTECRVRWPDGSEHWIAAKGGILNEPGAPTRMLGIVTDITQQKHAEEARIRAERLEAENRQIQEANRLKSQFLANMSHELRTPLNAVIGFAELLRSGAVPATSPKHDEYLGHIGTSGRHLLQLINDVLDLSKVESGKFEFFPEPVSLPALVGEVRAVLANGIERKRLNVAIDIDPALETLVIDPARLKQVLYNYLSNAIKFTAEGGHVTVRGRGQGPKRFRVEVEDDGQGIAADDLPRLFVEFQQLDAGYSKQHQGTGLGLALTRRLVEAQGGSVGVRSTPGLGSVFHFVLDRVHTAPVDGGSVPQRCLLIQSGSRGTTRLAQALSDAGFEVETAHTAEQAMARNGDRLFDALALDLLPGANDALSTLEGLRRDGPNRRLPVVGMAMPAGNDDDLAFAVDDVLCKPIRTDEVLAAMSRLALPGDRPARVMIVDDDPIALDLMRSTLESIGVQARGWLDGREALRALAQHRPDAIVLDLMMPGFDGFEMLGALQGLPDARDIPVFVWTSMILSDEEYASLARAAQAVVRKGGGETQILLERLRRGRPETPPGSRT